MCLKCPRVSTGLSTSSTDWPTNEPADKQRTNYTLHTKKICFVSLFLSLSISSLFFSSLSLSGSLLLFLFLEMFSFGFVQLVYARAHLYLYFCHSFHIFIRLPLSFSVYHFFTFDPLLSLFLTLILCDSLWLGSAAAAAAVAASFRSRREEETSSWTSTAHI